MRWIAKSGAGLAGILLLGACGGGAEPYPQEAREAFLSSCKIGAGEELCSCILSSFEEKYSFEEFSALEQRMLQGDTAVGEEILAMRKACGA